MKHIVADESVNYPGPSVEGLFLCNTSFCV